MEYLKGDLKNFVRIHQAKNKLKVDQGKYEPIIKKIFKQILLALCFLHDKNIAHLNISEKSIMLVHKNPT